MARLIGKLRHFFFPDHSKGVQVEFLVNWSCLVLSKSEITDIKYNYKFFTLRSFLNHYWSVFSKFPVLYFGSLSPVERNLYLQRGAISFGSTGTGGASGGVVTISMTPSGSNTIMLGTHHGQGNTGVTSMVFNTSENLAAAVENTNAPYSGIWYVVAPTATTANLVITFAGGGSHGGTGMVLTGAVQSSPIGTTLNTTAGTGTTASATFTTGTDNSLNVDALAIDSSGSTQSPTVSGTNQTGRTDFAPSSFNQGATSTQSTTTAGSYTMSWSWGSSKQYSQAAVEIKPFVAAPATILILR